MLDELVAAPPVPITRMARDNIRAQRARLHLTQASVARRMNQLGYHWYPQTAGLVERNDRPLLADELTALALCLETTPAMLAGPPADVSAVLFGDQEIPAQRLVTNDDSVHWDDSDQLNISVAAAARAEIAYLDEVVLERREPEMTEVRQQLAAIKEQLAALSRDNGKETDGTDDREG